MCPVCEVIIPISCHLHSHQTGVPASCQRTLDPRIERGQPKAETGRDHVHADVYAKTADEARRAALEAVEGEKQAMLAETQKLLQEAQEKNAEAQKVRDAANEHFEKVVMLAKAKARDEHNRIVAKAKVDQPAALTKALDENRQLKVEISGLRTELSQWKAFVESIKATLARLFGDQVEAIKDRINGDWAKQSENPNRTTPKQGSEVTRR